MTQDLPSFLKKTQNPEAVLFLTIAHCPCIENHNCTTVREKRFLCCKEWLHTYNTQWQ